MFPILEARLLATAVKQFKIAAPEIAKKRKPGQFIVLRIHEEGERIPLTIADADAEAGTITLIFQEVGKSTEQLGKLKAGDTVSDLIGPLGVPTHIEKYGTVVCVGGGIGIAPVYPIAKAMREAGNTVISIIGARTKNLLILEEEMARVSHSLKVSTDDGSYGYHGFVSDILQDIIDEGMTINLVVAIGPVPMMRVVCNVTKNHKIKTVVSLNPIMVDATGMCGACRVTVGGRTRFVCVDGPEFDGHEVNFAELVKRQRAYLNQEKLSLETFRHQGGACMGGIS
ncbi:MAG: sulfide/dihydroorotate dehydrogenase-like FAD/NAD-binding protein [Thermodesulfobacteriota bacterium]|nr:sulfide/dihydroorotate dehydrogenase-like FAD/NAD-binding protein [Thermodesulfobacteriota bacterium]